MAMTFISCCVGIMASTPELDKDTQEWNNSFYESYWVFFLS